MQWGLDFPPQHFMQDHRCEMDNLVKRSNGMIVDHIFYRLVKCMRNRNATA